MTKRPAKFLRFCKVLLALPLLAVPQAFAQNASPAPAIFETPRPLVKIRFDRPDVQYEQAIYMAVSQALEKYPNAYFSLVAIHPGSDNAARSAIESTRARRHAQKVLQSLTEMGLPVSRVDLSYGARDDISSSEVHLLIR